MSKITEKAKWYWKRLRAMRAEEVYHRIANAALRRTEKSGREKIMSAPAPGNGHDSISLPDPAAAPKAVVEGVEAACKDILSGSWTLFGERRVELEMPPAWKRDHLAEVDVDRMIPSHKLDHRTLPGGAECRCIWEINRWSEIVQLAKGAFLLGDQVAADSSVALLDDWVTKNPVGYGINWTSPVEAAIRLINFVWIDTLLRSSSKIEIPHRQLDDLVQAIAPAHTWWVWRYRSHGSSANNHLLGELSALVVALSRWPSLENWAKPATGIIDKFEQEVLRQFSPDGGNREQSLHYHLVAWEMAWHGTKAIGRPTAAVTRRLSAAAKFFNEMAAGNEPWHFGDCDDAVITPLWSNRERSTGEWIEWFSESADKSENGLQYWWGDAPHVPYDPADYHGGWTVYLQTGIAVHHTEGWKLRLDASPIGYLATAAHGHLDALHLSVWFKGKALLIDPGTGAYYTSSRLREHLSSWEAHNGPHFSHQHTPRRAGPFLWEGHHERPHFDLGDPTEIRVEFDIGSDVLHRNVERKRESDLWEITDTADSMREFCVNWQVAPGVRVRELAERCFLLESGEDKFIMTVKGASQLELGEAACSPRFRETATSPVLRVTSSGTASPLITQISRQPAAGE